MSKMLKPATLGLLLALFAGAFYTTNSAAQVYPSKPVRLIIPFPPGGSNDVVGRMIAFQLSERLGKQVVADNQGAGAGGIIGTEAAARSEERRVGKEWRGGGSPEHGKREGWGGAGVAET